VFVIGAGIGQPEDIRALPAAVMPAGATRFAIERGLEAGREQNSSARLQPEHGKSSRVSGIRRHSRLWRTSSPHWRGWLKPENRCLVPANSFSEYAPEANPATGKKDVVWFALDESRPLFAFAGIWGEYRGDRGTKSKPIPGPHNVYGFLTTSPNAVVAPIHPKAMPVILTTDEERRLDARAMGGGESVTAAIAR
jgi:putative SOS response-associated peptidase YedK